MLLELGLGVAVILILGDVVSVTDDTGIVEVDVTIVSVEYISGDRPALPKN